MALKVATPSGANRLVQFAHTSATTAKVPIVSGGRVWIPMNTALANVANTFLYAGEIDEAPKEGTQAWTVGALLYWDAVNSRFTTTVGTNTKAGYALEVVAGGAGDTTSGLIAFDSFAQ